MCQYMFLSTPADRQRRQRVRMPGWLWQLGGVIVIILLLWVFVEIIGG